MIREEKAIKKDDPLHFVPSDLPFSPDEKQVTNTTTLADLSRSTAFARRYPLVARSVRPERLIKSPIEPLQNLITALEFNDHSAGSLTKLTASNEAWVVRGSSPGLMKAC